MAETEEMKTEHHGFEAEVAKLLKLMVHSVYSEREIFLRELISNASDACDRLRYAAITAPELLGEDADFAIEIIADTEAGTLTIADNGIGMNKDDLIAHLGTIARSGTAAFVDALTGDAKSDVSLIGQFGVGFYSAFMVADKVTVTSRRAGEEQAWLWESTGEGDYTVAPADGGAPRGTQVRLHLKDDAKEFLERTRLTGIVKTYSDHIAVPIRLATGEADESGDPVNQGSALWTRPKSDITAEQHGEFFHHVGGFGEPALTLHYKAEGKIEYTVLLYVPSLPPFDLFDPGRHAHVRLYVKRVFITGEADDLLPSYLRFLRGVVDSEDLPLNISREMLQNNPVMALMRKAVTNRVLSELEKRADKEPEKFAGIWETFGAVLKEGLYEDGERRESLLKLARFKTSAREGWVSLADYVAAMKDKQSAIYYVSGLEAEAVARSPQLEGFKARGIEVLLLSDPVDDFWLQAIPDFEGKPFRSITKGATDLGEIAPEQEPEDGEEKTEPVGAGDMVKLTTVLKEALGDDVKAVRASDRLVESPACLVADESDLDVNLERILKAHNQLGGAAAAKILEINPGHPLIAAMAEKARGDGALAALEGPAHLLLDQARIASGEPVRDAADFATRLAEVLRSSLDR